MPSDFFTRPDGDVILRAGQEPGPTHDFRVHKHLLSVTSPVFKDMLNPSPPPNQNNTKQPILPIVDIPYSPEALDVFLHYFYVKPLPKFDPLTLMDLFSFAEAYKTPLLWPALKESLKSLLPGDPFAVYLIACRHGLVEEAKGAAVISTPRSHTRRDYGEEIQHVPDVDTSRFISFVQQREDAGLAIIQDVDRWSPSGLLGECSGCDKDWSDANGFRLHLAKIAEERFTRNPCVEFMDLFPPAINVLQSARHLREQNDACSCPLQKIHIRDFISDLVRDLGALNHKMLARFFSG